MKDEWARSVKVMLTCIKEYKLESDVEFVNIEEDFEGRDLLTYICPECGEQHESFRVV